MWLSLARHHLLGHRFGLGVVDHRHGIARSNTGNQLVNQCRADRRTKACGRVPTRCSTVASDVYRVIELIEL